MSESVNFPVPPNDLRYLVRLERSRAPPSPPPHSRDPPERTETSVVAEHTLRRYMKRPGSACKPRESHKAATQKMVVVRCILIAAALIPIELIYLLMCRPDLSGRRLRARFIKPADVRRTVFLHSLPASTLLNRFRI